MSYTKDPQAVLDYARDWTDYLADGESITSSTWVVPDGITKASDSHDASSATIWLSGGTAGELYFITNRIVTNQGRTDDRSLIIRVQER